jgi:uncharacterized protein (DUF1697 family)
MASRQSYAALLRGINLGARNKVSMADLRALVEGLGADDVVTYVQSGNVVFKTDRPRAQLRKALERAIARELGLDVTVVLRTKAELAKLVRDNPLLKRGRESNLHVTFLADPPAPAKVKALAPPAGPGEFRVVGKDVVLHLPGGYGRSKLSNAFFERQLGVAATTRNWRTVTKLAELV